jgi:AraC-like DNA-binding protein
MPNSSEPFHSRAVERFQLSVGSESGTGIKQYKLNKGEIYNSTYKDYNLIVFLLEGRMLMNSSEGLGNTVCKGEFFFLPISAELSCLALSACNFLLFFFDRFGNTCDRSYFRNLSKLPARDGHSLRVVGIRHPLLHFAQEITTYWGNLMDNTEYQRIKCEECIFLLRSLYSKEEMLEVFYPIAGKAIDFRVFVLRNYLKVKNIHGLVELSGLKRKTFDRQFNYEFGQSPYQWVLQQKAKHIRYDLSETNGQMQEIMKKYGFIIAPHFTRFCKEYFNSTPLELRRHLRMEKSQAKFY